MSTIFKRTFPAVVFVLIASLGFAQAPVEKVFELSKAAKGGYLYATEVNAAGNFEVTYQIPKNKKEIKYETYEFDKDFNLIKTTESEVDKTKLPDKPDINVDFINASVGGGSSFTILGTKLNLYRVTATKKWDKEKKRYKFVNYKSEDFKPKNESNKSYSGYAAYTNNTTGEMIALVTSEAEKGSKEKAKKDFALLQVKKDLTFNEIPFNFEKQQTLVYTTLMRRDFVSDDEDNLDNSDMIFVFADDKDGDASNYTYYKIAENGKVFEKIPFKNPGAVVPITAHYQKDNVMYFTGVSLKSDKYFSQMIGEYSPLENYHYLKNGYENSRMESYTKKLETTKFNDFVLMKVANGKLAWSNSTPIAEFKSKLKTPPSSKGVKAYEGKKFFISDFMVDADENFLIAGQLVRRDIKYNMQYKDVVCLHMDKNGKLLAQYGASPASVSDKENNRFSIPQYLINGQNSGNLYWALYEVQATKGYASWSDAYNGSSTLYAHYFPSIAKIDKKSNTVTDFNQIGGKKYLLNPNVMPVTKDNSMLFVCENKKKGTILLARYDFL